MPCSPSLAGLAQIRALHSLNNHHSSAVDCEIVNINRYKHLDVRYEWGKKTQKH